MGAKRIQGIEQHRRGVKVSITDLKKKWPNLTFRDTKTKVAGNIWKLLEDGKITEDQVRKAISRVKKPKTQHTKNREAVKQLIRRAIDRGEPGAEELLNQYEEDKTFPKTKKHFEDLDKITERKIGESRRGDPTRRGRTFSPSAPQELKVLKSDLQKYNKYVDNLRTAESLRSRFGMTPGILSPELVPSKLSPEHLAATSYFPEFRDTPGNISVKRLGENVQRKALTTGPELFRAAERIAGGKGVGIEPSALGDINRLSDLSRSGRLNPNFTYADTQRAVGQAARLKPTNILDITDKLRDYEELKKLRNKGRPVIGSLGTDAVKKGYGRTLWDLFNRRLKGVKSLGGLAALPPAFLASILYPDRADAIMKYTSAAIDPIGSLLFPYGEGYSKGTPGGAAGWRQSMIDPNWSGLRGYRG